MGQICTTSSEGVSFDPEEILLWGSYSDELSLYRARSGWRKVLESTFMLDEGQDFILTISVDYEGIQAAAAKMKPEMEGGYFCDDRPSEMEGGYFCDDRPEKSHQKKGGSRIPRIEGGYFKLCCKFNTACGRYTFWRITNYQAPEAQYEIETAHIPHSISRNMEFMTAPDMLPIESKPLVTSGLPGQNKISLFGSMAAKIRQFQKRFYKD